MINSRIIFSIVCLAAYSCSPNNIESPVVTILEERTSIASNTDTITPQGTRTGLPSAMNCEQDISNNLEGKLLLTAEDVEGNTEGGTDIYLYHLNKNVFQRVTSDHRIDYMPAITRDGKQVAFISNRYNPGNFGLYIINIPANINLSDIVETISKPIKIIAGNDIDISYPDYSFDDKWIAYTLFKSERAGSYANINIINAKSYIGTKVVTDNILSYRAFWSKYDNSLFIVNDNKYSSYGSQIDITSLNDIFNQIPSKIIKLNEDVLFNQIDIDNKSQIVLTLINNQKSGIYKISTRENSALIKIRDENNVNSWDAIWAPGGEWIAFKDMEKEIENIYLYNDITKSFINAYKLSSIGTSILWSPNSKYIAFTEKRGENSLFICVFSLKSIISNTKGCTNKPIEIGPINAHRLELVSWIY